MNRGEHRFPSGADDNTVDTSNQEKYGEGEKSQYETVRRSGLPRPGGQAAAGKVNPEASGLAGVIAAEEANGRVFQSLGVLGFGPSSLNDRRVA